MSEATKRAPRKRAPKKDTVIEAEFEVVNDNAPAVRQPRPTVERMYKPAESPEARERQMVNLAVNLAEKQLVEGTASSAVIVHYLKMASKKEHLERTILEENAKLIQAKTSSIVQEKDNKNLAEAAIKAMKSYQPSQ